MIGNVHLKQSIKGVWKKLALLCLLLFFFEFMFSYLGTSSYVQSDIVKDLKDMPPMVEKMMGKGFFEAMLKYGIISIGYIHPFMMAAFILFVFLTVSQVLTSEISSGTIGFTLSKPVSRMRLFFNMGVIIYVGLGLLAFSAYLSSALGIELFHAERLSAGPFASLAWNLYIIMIFIAGYVVMLAAISDTGKMLFTWGGGTFFFLYLLNMATPLWQPLKYTSFFNPFSYYNAFGVLMGIRLSLSTSISIFISSLIMFGVGAFVFSRRDIPAG